MSTMQRHAAQWGRFSPTPPHPVTVTGLAAAEALKAYAAALRDQAEKIEITSRLAIPAAENLRRRAEAATATAQEIRHAATT